MRPFARSLRQETHVLSRRPDLLWQQLYNRLQWEQEPPPAPGGGAPWLRLKSPLRESRTLIQTLEGHDAEVKDCAIAPDGSYLVSASSDGTLKMWDSSGRELRTLRAHEKGVETCAIAPDGSFLASAGQDGVLRLWSPSSGREILSLDGADAIWACAVAPDSSFVVFASDAVTLRLVDPSSGATLRELRGHTGAIIDCAVSPDRQMVASTGSDGEVMLWDVDSGRELWSLRRHGVDALKALNAAGHFPDQPIFKHVNACAIAPDGSCVVSAGADDTLRVWDPATGEELRVLKGHGGIDDLEDCAVTPDGLSVVGAARDGTLTVWDLATGAELLSFEGHAGQVNACALSADGSLLVSASDDHTVKLWDARLLGPESKLREGHREKVSDCAVAPDGSYVLSVSWEYYAGETVRLVDTADGHEVMALRSDVWGISGCAIAADGSFMAWAGNGQAPGDGDLELWDAKRGMRLRTLTAKAGSCAISPDSSMVITAEGIWDAASGNKVATLQGDTGEVSDCALTPDGSLLVTASSDGTVIAWALESRERTISFETGEEILSCAVAPDHSFVVCGSRPPREPGVLGLRIPDLDGSLKLWDLSTGTEMRALGGPQGWVAGCAVSPDGSLVVSAGADGSLRLWDPGSGRELAAMFLPAPLHSLALGPTGTLIACGDEAGTVHLVDVEGIEPGLPIRPVRRR